MHLRVSGSLDYSVCEATGRRRGSEGRWTAESDRCAWAGHSAQAPPPPCAQARSLSECRPRPQRARAPPLSARRPRPARPPSSRSARAKSRLHRPLRPRPTRKWSRPESGASPLGDARARAGLGRMGVWGRGPGEVGGARGRATPATPALFAAPVLTVHSGGPAIVGDRSGGRNPSHPRRPGTPPNAGTMDPFHPWGTETPPTLKAMDPSPLGTWTPPPIPPRLWVLPLRPTGSLPGPEPSGWGPGPREPSVALCSAAQRGLKLGGRCSPPQVLQTSACRAPMMPWAVRGAADHTFPGGPGLTSFQPALGTAATQGPISTAPGACRRPAPRRAPGPQGHLGCAHRRRLHHLPGGAASHKQPCAPPPRLRPAGPGPRTAGELWPAAGRVLRDPSPLPGWVSTPGRGLRGVGQAFLWQL